MACINTHDHWSVRGCVKTHLRPGSSSSVPRRAPWRVLTTGLVWPWPWPSSELSSRTSSLILAHCSLSHICRTVRRGITRLTGRAGPDVPLCSSLLSRCGAAQWNREQSEVRGHCVTPAYSTTLTESSRIFFMIFNKLEVGAHLTKSWILHIIGCKYGLKRVKRSEQIKDFLMNSTCYF